MQRPIFSNSHNQSSHRSFITFTADQPYTVAVPNATITLDPNASCASTTFDAASNTWMTTVQISL